MVRLNVSVTHHEEPEMKRRETEQKIRQAYDDIIDRLAGQSRSGRLPGYEQVVRNRSKFDSCGRALITPYGREVWHWCRRSTCPTCATFWGRKLGRGLVAACPDAVTGDYRMLTLIGGIVQTPDDAFDMFRALRRSLRNALDYRRRTPGIDRAGWRSFGMAGAFELDQFLAEDFRRLGDHKQQQYRQLGFDPARAHGPQWVVTIHALIHVGVLGNADVQNFFEGLAPVAHVQALDGHKDLIESAEDIGGYSAKVGLTTVLAHGEVRPWSPEIIADYVAATIRCSHGRQSFRLSVRPVKAGPKRGSEKFVQNYKADNLEPLPVLF